MVNALRAQTFSYSAGPQHHPLKAHRKIRTRSVTAGKETMRELVRKLNFARSAIVPAKSKNEISQANQHFLVRRQQEAATRLNAQPPHLRHIWLRIHLLHPFGQSAFFSLAPMKARSLTEITMKNQNTRGCPFLRRLLGKPDDGWPSERGNHK